MGVFLETGRLLPCRFPTADARDLFDLDSDPEVMSYIDGGEPASYETIQGRALPGSIDYYKKYDHYTSNLTSEEHAATVVDPQK